MTPRNPCRTRKAYISLYDLQVLREIIPVFETKDTLFYKLHLLNWQLYALLTSENDIHLYCTVTLGCYISCITKK